MRHLIFIDEASEISQEVYDFLLKKGEHMFKVGELVEWESQANSGYTKKQGVILGIIESREPFRVAISRLKIDESKFVSKYGGGLARNHVSYVIMKTNGDRKPQLYWPIVSKLKQVSKV